MSIKLNEKVTMFKFCSENHICVQELMTLVCKGNVILSEIVKWKDKVPKVFKGESDQFKDVVLDFNYFVDCEATERRIETVPETKAKDEKFRINYFQSIQAYYDLLESVYEYSLSLREFAEDLLRGKFIGSTIESLLEDDEGKQLLAESVQLCGSMLLLIDHYIEGTTREKLLTCYYRYSGLHSNTLNLDGVCKLFRSTGYFAASQKRPSYYPLPLFKRVAIPEKFVQALVGRLRTNDIYNQQSSYPLPEHRCMALRTQASVLFVALCFCPATVKTDTSMMKELVDRFFSDNWVIPVYLGFSINLIDAWSSFPAAQTALETVISKLSLNRIIDLKASKAKKLMEEASLLLQQDDNMLEKSAQVISFLREGNVYLNWMFMHAFTVSAYIESKKAKQIRDKVTKATGFDPYLLLKLLISISHIELKVKNHLKTLLDERPVQWNCHKQHVVQQITKLAEICTGDQSSYEEKKKASLNNWLTKKSGQIERLAYDELAASGRKIRDFINAFKVFRQMETDSEVCERVMKIEESLQKMRRTENISEEVLVTVQIIADFGYAWGAPIECLVPTIQCFIKNDPSKISEIRAIFVKLSSVIDLPLMRLAQAKSPSLVKVSSFFSEELVNFVQKVLQIIPETMFSILHQIISLQTTSIQELPTRLYKNDTKSYMQLESRHKVAELTQHMSLLTEGLLMMKSTLMGIVRLEPSTLLEKGMRRELVRQIIDIYVRDPQSEKVFGKSAFTTNLEKNLEIIGIRIMGIRRSLEYIGDYVHCHSLKVYLQEFEKVMKLAVCRDVTGLREASCALTESDGKDSFTLVEMNLSRGFLEELIAGLETLTSPEKTMYVVGKNSWYDTKLHCPVLTPQLFLKMEIALDVSGMDRISSALSSKLADLISKVIKDFKMLINRKDVSSVIKEIKNSLSSVHKTLKEPNKLYTLWEEQLNLRGASFLPTCYKIGQIQLLRKRIQYQLAASSNATAKQLCRAMHNVNTTATISQTRNNEIGSSTLDSARANQLEDSLLSDVIATSDRLGISEPLIKIYEDEISRKLPSSFAILLSVLTVQQIHRYSFNKHVGILGTRSSSDPIDAIPFVTFLATILTHTSSSILQDFISYLCQYLNSVLVTEPLTESYKKDLCATFHFILTLARIFSRKENVFPLVTSLLPSFYLIPNIVSRICI